MPKGYRPMPLEPNGVFYAIRTAAKAHPCDVRKGCTIQPGEEYVDQVTAPWTEIIDDVDDDGRPTGYPLGKWERYRFHNDHPARDVARTAPSVPIVPTVPRLPESLNPSNRYGGGDPLADYLYAKGEL